ncbi:MAG TPA: HAMP domain-containing sensor histidine kinase [Pyrinomonadaceae bacterium]|jgi:signal transduction histidine kinase|nr:HAMP domain-containing sensor histidine kinase [Pyrinomonadaceae bacterium]
MIKLRNFLKRHVLLVGLVAVVAPLLCILALQYWSLLKLEKTSSVADKVWMKNYLADVATEVKYYYKNYAEQILNVPAYALTEERLAKGKSPFGTCESRSAKRLFVITFSPQGDSKTYFYEPSCKSLINVPVASEARAINVAVASFKQLSKEQAVVKMPGITSDDRDPENRLIFKPVLDEESKIIGVVGFIIDVDYFKRELLPQTINASLPKFYPDGTQDSVIVSVYDYKKNQIYATQPMRGQNDDTWISLPYFYDLHLGIQSRNMTPEQWARWNFIVNLSLSILMTTVLIGGIGLALRTASRELRVSQMKTDFVSNVSHELRTPLSSVRVFGEFLRLGRVSEPEKIREYGQYIETESRRLTQLINNILDFSKIESGRKTYQFERADIGEVIAETLKTLEVQLKQNGFSVIFEAPPTPLPPTVIDADAIAQAFMNLLDNAVKYSGTAREIVVRLDAEDGLIRLSVTDHGIGIAREEQEKIFEKFYRVSTGLVHDVKGSGLGLSLVKHIVEAHRGKVTVRSEPGRGSSFTIHLPAEKTSGEDAQKSQGSKPRVKDERPLALGFKDKKGFT